MAEDNQWYFAYGSNMLSDVFVTRRKVQPLRSEVASINTHTLCFNVMGVPYTDPAMGGIRPIEKGESKLPVYGVAYLLTMEDMRRVIISEGLRNKSPHCNPTKRRDKGESDYFIEQTQHPSRIRKASFSEIHG
ncbi:hypothetical protein ARAM_006075 [Aspergillus rambellii]|uniref:gamma-glutamylcyclotransferase n=1 Tax=Aspergillus rambellii TaxID=308745 RepID=A0A0F8U303_9EURO|nr:hypothetical protein ARAM_006075 [Aspergillus rambellii]